MLDVREDFGELAGLLVDAKYTAEVDSFDLDTCSAEVCATSPVTLPKLLSTDDAIS